MRNSALPIGSRIQFVYRRKLTIGHIHEGYCEASGDYRVRPLHSFKHISVKPDRIKGIEFIPGAPLPAPRFPQPQPRKVEPAPAPPCLCKPAGMNDRPCPLHGTNYIDPCPAPQSMGMRKPASSARCDCRNGHSSASGRCNARNIVDPTRYEGEVAFCEGCRANCPQPMLVRAAGKGEGCGPIELATESRGGDILRDISKGHYDDILPFIFDELKERSRIVRAIATQAAKAELKKGDRVRICGRIRPKRLVGQMGLVLADPGASKFISVKLDSQVRSVGIPANCLEKI